MDKSAAGCFEVREKHWASFGYGQSAHSSVFWLKSFGMKVNLSRYCNKNAAGGIAGKWQNLKIFLKAADFVSLHVPETPQTKNMNRDSATQKNETCSYLINASRGTVVDIPALRRCFDEPAIAGAP